MIRCELQKRFCATEGVTQVFVALSGEFGQTAKPNNGRPLAQRERVRVKEGDGTVGIPIAAWPKGSKQAIASF